jgi:hypothetical protein
MNNENTLIPLPGFVLRVDLPWTTGFVSLVENQLSKLRIRGGRFYPPRFFGYYFQHNIPIGIGGNWVVSLDVCVSRFFRISELERLTYGQYRIVSEEPETLPGFLLIHDRWDGVCCLWSFNDGQRFVGSQEPQTIVNS